MKQSVLLILLCLGACTYPVSAVHTLDVHPTLQVMGAPPSAVLLIDQQQAGWARNYGEGGHALVLAHGTHRIEIRNGPAVLYASDVYFGEDTAKIITLTPGVP